MNNNKILKLDFILPLLILAITTILFSIFDWDIQIQRAFYSQENGWFLGDSQPWQTLYKYSNIPALLISVSSLILLAISFFKTSLLKYRKILLFLSMVMALGPGLVVNTILKDNWGRPRPRNIVQFNGNYQYEKPLEIDLSSKGKSFPCGHASMGFYLVSFYFIFKNRKRKIAGLLLILGLVSGCLIGMARIVQGGHFASDVIWAGGIVYLIAAASYYLLGMPKKLFLKNDIQLPVKRNLIVFILLAAAITLATLLIMTAPNNYNKNYDYNFDSKNLYITIRLDRGDVKFVQAETIAINFDSNAHGFPWSKLKTKVKSEKLAELNEITIKQRESGYFAEVNQTVTVFLPENINCEVFVKIKEGNVIISEFANFKLKTDLVKGRVIK